MMNLYTYMPEKIAIGSPPKAYEYRYVIRFEGHYHVTVPRDYTEKDVKALVDDLNLNGPF